MRSPSAPGIRTSEGGIGAGTPHPTAHPLTTAPGSCRLRADDRAAMDSEMLVRYYRTWDLNLEAGSWFRQFIHKEAFDQPSWFAQPDDIENMLAGRYWIACYAPPSQRVRWLRFDLDCAAEAEVQDLLARYRALRALMGRHREPVVWQTPSGRGLRVAYAIPETSLPRLCYGNNFGLIPNVLRAAGLEPKAGRIEVFPQRKQADRLPLGRNMPLLDPETLVPLFGPLKTFDPEVLDKSLRVLEEALAEPFGDLLPELGLKPIIELVTVRDRSERTPGLESLFVRESDGRVAMGERLDRLIEEGLPARSTRYESEFLVAMAMHLDPDRFARYGVRAPTDDVRIARAVAAWLAEKHNHRSKEWLREMRSGTPRAAEAAFVRRYLNQNRDSGEHMIDRAQRAAANIDPLSVHVRQLSRAERELVLALSERRYRPGAQRYRCEVWLASFIRSVKENMHYRRKKERERFTMGAGGEERVEVEILAEWLENSPYGSGECSETGRTRYLDYLQILIDDGRVAMVRDYSHHPDPRMSRARTYHVRTPDAAVLRDLVYGGAPYAPWIMKRILPRITIDGNRGTAELDDVYHDLYLATAGINLPARYGRHSAGKILDRAASIERAGARMLAKRGVSLLRAA